MHSKLKEIKTELEIKFGNVTERELKEDNVIFYVDNGERRRAINLLVRDNRVMLYEMHRGMSLPVPGYEWTLDTSAEKIVAAIAKKRGLTKKAETVTEALTRLTEDDDEGLELLEEYTEYIRGTLDEIEDKWKANPKEYAVADDIAAELNKINAEIKKLVDKLN